VDLGGDGLGGLPPPASHPPLLFGEAKQKN